MTTEKRLERKLQNEVKKWGGLALKFTSPGFTGVPDRIVLLPSGKTLFVELKSKGATLSPRQATVQNKIAKLGFPVFTISSETELTYFLKFISYEI